MKFISLTLALILALSACNSTGDSDQAPVTSGDTASSTASPGKDATGNEAPANVGGCYLRVMKRDTLAASLQQSGNTVTGRLSFDNFEKDGSTGTVNGTVEGNIVKLVYSYRSEGMNSVMHVYFRIVDDGLVHGIGDVTTKGDTVMYADPARLSYAAEDKLLRLSCDQLPSKYK